MRGVRIADRSRHLHIMSVVTVGCCTGGGAADSLKRASIKRHEGRDITLSFSLSSRTVVTLIYQNNCRNHPSLDA